MEDIRHISTITEYDDMFGVETLHPLVSVIDLSKASPMTHSLLALGFYVVFLKEVKCGDMIYGRRTYDYQKGTIVCVAPGQVMGIKDNGETFQPKGYALCFHPDLIKGTSLGRTIGEYTFFSYEANEALHISEKERELFLSSLDNIRQELEHSIDHLSKRIIVGHIETLLNYCLRFYERQFITRQNVNLDILSRFETLLNQYFDNGNAQDKGLPSVKYFADALFLSPNYFGDLIKKETGKSAQEYIHYKIADIAKELIMDPRNSISEVAYDLGFQYPQHFTRLFKKVTGSTPLEYRSKMNS
jgi:AraC-like DNA-binding protein